nr:hypothetical protein [Curtobacterium sp. VKM Ac-2865]
MTKKASELRAWPRAENLADGAVVEHTREDRGRSCESGEVIDDSPRGDTVRCAQHNLRAVNEGEKIRGLLDSIHSVSAVRGRSGSGVWTGTIAQRVREGINFVPADCAWTKLMPDDVMPKKSVWVDQIDGADPNVSQRARGGTSNRTCSDDGDRIALKALERPACAKLYRA